jgi:molybdopterin/thiamine biosynthesis adenylyltransferase
VNVAVVGCGVRGSIVAALLTGAGVEQLSLIDGGFVAEADIAAGPLQFRPDLRASKADALVSKLALLNPAVHAQAFPADLDAENASAILAGVDVVVDCVGEAEVSEALAAAAQRGEIRLVAPGEEFSPAEVSSARAVAIGALQADEVLASR